MLLFLFHIARSSRAKTKSSGRHASAAPAHKVAREKLSDNL
jgi:hypothetical protein